MWSWDWSDQYPKFRIRGPWLRAGTCSHASHNDAIVSNVRRESCTSECDYGSFCAFSWVNRIDDDWISGKHWHISPTELSTQE